MTFKKVYIKQVGSGYKVLLADQTPVKPLAYDIYFTEEDGYKKLAYFDADETLTFEQLPNHLLKQIK